MKSITISALAAALTVAAPAAAHAGGYTLPDGTRITTPDRPPRTAPRTTLEQFRAKYPTHVTVKRGQTLWGLAATYRGSGYEWRAIARLNGVKGTTIYVGQVLRIR